MARARATLANEARQDITSKPVDITIPPPFIIDSLGNRQDLEWTVSGEDTRLTVQFQVDTFAYPVALDPTLQFTAPGTSGES